MVLAVHIGVTLYDIFILYRSKITMSITDILHVYYYSALINIKNTNGFLLIPEVYTSMAKVIKSGLSI
jgi:hypothetical protein